MGGDAQPLRQLFDLAQPLGLRHRLGRDVAHRDIAAFGDELARQLAAHARAASGDDGDLSSKILHWDLSLTFHAVFLICVSSFRRLDAGLAAERAQALRALARIRRLLSRLCDDASGIGAREKVFGNPCSDCA